MPLDAGTANSLKLQCWLAAITGFRQQYISGLEQGRRNPTVVMLYELATALGVSHLDLLSPRRDE